MFSLQFKYFKFFGNNFTKNLNPVESRNRIPECNGFIDLKSKRFINIFIKKCNQLISRKYLIIQNLKGDHHHMPIIKKLKTLKHKN